MRYVLGLLLTVLALQGTIAQPAAAKTFGGSVPDLPTGAHIDPRPVARAAQIPYLGGPVLHSNRTHLIFWAPAGSGLGFGSGSEDYESLTETFLRGVAADSRKPTNVYGLSGQYTDAHGPAAYESAYGGAVTATDPLPPNGCKEPATGPGWSVCLNDGQLEAELQHVVRVDRLPTGPTDVYFLLTPSGFGSCTDSSSSVCALGGFSGGYCGYHASINGQLQYAVIPYNAVPGHCQSGRPRPNSSPADPTISSLSHEHNEIVTDPFGNAWIDGTGNENGDLCITRSGPSVGGSGAGAWNAVIAGGHYFLQEEYSNTDGGCAARDEADSVSFAVPRTVARRRVSLSASAHDPDGAIVAYEWFFGEGPPARGRRVSHTFGRVGAYRVVLRSTDSSGNYAFASRLVRVARR